MERLILTDLPDNDLRLLAVDIAAGKVFHSASCENALDAWNLLLMAGAFDHPEEDLLQIGLVYEYFEKAMPRGVNGLPMFSSMKMINRADAERLQGYVNTLLQSRKDFVSSDPVGG